MSGRAQAGDAVIAPAILDEAAAWLVQLHAGEPSEADRQACAQWRQRSREHALAWARAERLLGRLGNLPPELAMPTLGRDRGLGRRQALKQLGVLLGAVPLAWAAWREAPWQDWLADQHTAIGEVREAALPDGSQLTLNTDSAVDLHFHGERRLVRLLRGELLLRIAAGHRPLLVDTTMGTLASSTGRFSLRERGDDAQLVVLEGTVRVSPRDGAPVWLTAGQQGRFDRNRVGSLTSADAAAVAWTRGMLMADRMALGELAAELARYRRGVLRCDPAVAGLAISGAYPLHDRERSLAMLAATYPVRVRRLTDYWISLEPAGA